MFFIGIDGGGSKTKIQCYNAEGKLLAEDTVGTTDYHQIGVDGVIQTLNGAANHLGFNGWSECLVGFGMPAYGENKKEDDATVEEIIKAFPEARINVENDVFCAWAGAMAFSAGVTVVCGTGSMAVGSDKSGKMARSGGWSEFFSDEGSGYWLGKKTLELFAKQSDSRLPRGPLYNLIRKHFKIGGGNGGEDAVGYGDSGSDFDIINIVNAEYIISRKKTASLQMILMEASKQGDIAALTAYEQALEEIVSIVLGTVRQLDFGDGEIDISYIGGLFNEEELFLNPFKRALGEHFKANVFAPKLSPCHGALLFALDKFEKDNFEKIRSNFLRANSHTDL